MYSLENATKNFSREARPGLGALLKKRYNIYIIYNNYIYI